MGGLIVGRSTYSAMGAINALGLGTNLQLCLDAGDVNSYSGSGQSWLDLSGNGYDFFRGADNTETTDDPTFNGSAGALTSAEYWSFDGGDDFTYDTTNETWMDALHKDNAVLTAACWVYPGSSSDSDMLLSTMNSTLTGTGISWFFNTTAKTLVWLPRNAGTAVTTQSTTGELTYNEDAWNFCAISLDESVGAGGIKWQLNTGTATDTSTYTSPSSSAASATMKIGSFGIDNWLASGSRMAVMCVWSRALSATEMMDFFNATRDRFGI